MPETIFQCGTKATWREGNRISFSLNWAFARRAKLVLTDTELVCGDWHIPYAEIEDAALLGIPTLWGTARNLMVRWQGRIYQVQLKSQSLWRMEAHAFGDGRVPC